MTKEQMIHIGMINSFNVITERNSYDEIAMSSVNLFAHHPDEDPPLQLIRMMVEYFQSFEMYEYCLELTKYYEKNFNQDGTRKEPRCECEQPIITEYSKKMFCGQCKKRLTK